MLYTLVYKSTALVELDRYELNPLLHQARARNKRLKITGLLLYANKRFLQVLEGEEKNVLSLYSEIQQDPRHTKLEVLMQNPIDKRMFPDWSMGYRKIDSNEYKNIPALSMFIDDDKISKPYELLLEFREEVIKDDN